MPRTRAGAALSPTRLRAAAEGDFCEIQPAVLALQSATASVKEKAEAHEQAEAWTHPFFLQSDYDPAFATAPQLRKLLLGFDIGEALSAKKSRLVELFDAEVRPMAEAIRAARLALVRPYLGGARDDARAHISPAHVRQSTSTRTPPAPPRAAADAGRPDGPSGGRRASRGPGASPSVPSGRKSPPAPVASPPRASPPRAARRSESPAHSESPERPQSPPAFQTPPRAAVPDESFATPRRPRPRKSRAAAAPLPMAATREQLLVQKLIDRQERARLQTRRAQTWALALFLWAAVGLLAHWRWVLGGYATFCESSTGAWAGERSWNPLVQLLPVCAPCPPHAECTARAVVRCTGNETLAGNVTGPAFYRLWPSPAVSLLRVAGVPAAAARRWTPFPWSEPVCVVDRVRATAVQRLGAFVRDELAAERGARLCSASGRRDFDGEPLEMPLTELVRRAAAHFSVDAAHEARFRGLWTSLTERWPLVLGDGAPTADVWLVSRAGETHVRSRVAPRVSPICAVRRAAAAHAGLLGPATLAFTLIVWAFIRRTRASVRRRRQDLVVAYLVRLVKNTLIEAKHAHHLSKLSGSNRPPPPPHRVIAQLLDLYLLPDNHAVVASSPSRGTPSSTARTGRFSWAFGRLFRPWARPPARTRLSAKEPAAPRDISLPANRLLASFDPRIRQLVVALSLPELQAVWTRVRDQVSRDSNIRTSCPEIDGMPQEVWEWMGALPLDTSFGSPGGF